MKKIFFAFLLTLIAIPCFADRLAGASPTVKKLIAHEEFLNDKCRGGSGDEAKTWQYCKERDKVTAHLKALGWCYGSPGLTDSDYTWKRCTALARSPKEALYEDLVIPMSPLKRGDLLDPESVSVMLMHKPCAMRISNANLMRQYALNNILSVETGCWAINNTNQVIMIDRHGKTTIKPLSAFTPVLWYKDGKGMAMPIATR